MHLIVSFYEATNIKVLYTCTIILAKNTCMYLQESVRKHNYFNWDDLNLNISQQR